MTKIIDAFSAKKLSSLGYETPFLLTDISLVEQKYRDLQTFFPGSSVYYAMKSNPDQKILKALDSMGSRFEIASYGELEILQSIGVKSKDVIYSNPVKSPIHITRAYEAGVSFFSFDSINELNKIAENAPNSNVYLRLKVTDQGSVFPLSSKFGAIPREVVDLMKKAKKMDLRPCGITFHVGSQSADIETWKAAIETSGRSIWELQQEGIMLDFLNIGGGLPVEYTKKISSIEDIARAIHHSLHIHLPYSLNIYLEPGRFLSADSSVLVASVIGREKRGNSDWIYLDVGVFQGLMECLEMPGWRLPIYTDEIGNKPELAPFTITGPTCDAQDTIGNNIMLPKNIAVGDRVYIGQAGAYTLTYAAPSFNGFAPPAAYYSE